MGLRLTALLIAVVLLGGCTGSSDRAAPSPTPEGLPPPVSVEPASVDEDLSALLVDSPPQGFMPADPDDYQVGPLDLGAAAASEVDQDAERSLLVTRGFERGYAKAWTRERDVVMVLVYRFASAKGAKAYLADGIELALGRGAEPFDVAEVDGAHGFSRVEEDEDGPLAAHAVVYVRDRDFFLVLVASPGSGLGPDDARTIARRQVGTGTEGPDGE